MNVVDSSGWIEYITDAPNGSLFADVITSSQDLVVPNLTVYEVFKRVCALSDETSALESIGEMLEGEVVDLSPALAIDAAVISLDTGLAMADAIILATARAYHATLWTQDEHFKGMEGVEYREPTRA